MLLTVQRLPEFYQIQLFDSDVHWLCSFNRLSLTKHLCQCQNNWNMFLKHCCLMYFWLSLKSLWHPWPCFVIRSAPPTPLILSCLTYYPSKFCIKRPLDSPTITILSDLYFVKHCCAAIPSHPTEWPDLKFVANVTTGGRVKNVPAV